MKVEKLAKNGQMVQNSQPLSTEGVISTSRQLSTMQDERHSNTDGLSDIDFLAAKITMLIVCDVITCMCRRWSILKELAVVEFVLLLVIVKIIRYHSKSTAHRSIAGQKSCSLHCVNIDASEINLNLAPTRTPSFQGKLFHAKGRLCIPIFVFKRSWAETRNAPEPFYLTFS